MEEQSKVNTYPNKKKTSWVLLVLALIYAAFPADFIPDIPVAGQIDDFFVLSAATTNFIQQQFFQTNKILNKCFQFLKWILIISAIMTILTAILIVTLIVKI